MKLLYTFRGHSQTPWDRTIRRGTIHVVEEEDSELLGVFFDTFDEHGAPVRIADEVKHVWFLTEDGERIDKLPAGRALHVKHMVMSDTGSAAAVPQFELYGRLPVPSGPGTKVVNAVAGAHMRAEARAK